MPRLALLSWPWARSFRNSMRTFFVVTFALVALVVVNVTPAYAACVLDETNDTYYDSDTFQSCTPQSGGTAAGGSSDCAVEGRACTSGGSTGTCRYDETGYLSCTIFGGGGGSVGAPATGNPSGSVPQTGNPGTTLINPLKSGSSLESFLGNILDFVIRIGTVIVILMMVFVGYKFVAAKGNDTKITEARTMLLWTVVGALILLGAQVIATGIRATVQALTTGG